MIKKEKKPRKRRLRKVNLSKLTGISFLPSVFTLFNLFLGFAALKNIINNNYTEAAYLIVISVIMDGFDGTVARLTKTESDFGMQLDSLVDAVSFGLVPGFFIYLWGFTNNPSTFELIGKNFGKIGLVVGFLYVSAGVIRLARFNVFKNADAFPSNVFIGLPIPGAALSILSFVLFTDEYIKTKPNYFFIIFAIYSLIIAYLMISNVKYRTVKKINSKHSLVALFILASIIGSAIIFPKVTIPAMTFLYLTSPILFAIFSKKNIKKEDVELESK